MISRPPVVTSRPTCSKPTVPPKLTLRRALETYHVSRGHSANTLDGYFRTLKHWERLTDDPDVRSITNASLRQFRELMAATPLPTTGRPPKPGTVNGVLRTVSAVFGTIGPVAPGYPDSLDIVDHRPACKLLPTEDQEPVYISSDDLSAIYAYCAMARFPSVRKSGVPPCHWWRAALVYLFNCGDRRSEWLSLTWDQIDLDAAVVKVRVGKSKTWRMKPLSAETVEHLRAIEGTRTEATSRVFAGPKSPRHCHAVFAEIQAAAGVTVHRDADDRRGSHYTFHEIRKTCATALWQHNPAAAQAMLCHSDMKTTQKHYAGVDPALQAAAAQVDQPAAWAIASRTSSPPTPDPPDSSGPATIAFPRLA